MRPLFKLECAYDEETGGHSSLTHEVPFTRDDENLPLCDYYPVGQAAGLSKPRKDHFQPGQASGLSYEASSFSRWHGHDMTPRKARDLGYAG